MAIRMTSQGNRLSVNVAPAVGAALARVVEREGVTLTEALRRLVEYGDRVYEAVNIDGDDLAVRCGDVVERIVLLV